jgi:hypothetical protein
MLQKAGRIQEALSWYDDAASGGDPDAMRQAIWMLKEAGQTDEVISCCRLALMRVTSLRSGKPLRCCSNLVKSNKRSHGTSEPLKLLIRTLALRRFECSTRLAGTRMLSRCASKRSRPMKHAIRSNSPFCYVSRILVLRR